MSLLENADFVSGPLTATFLLGIATVILLYWYSPRTHGYWKERGVPFTPPIPLFGSIYETMKKPFHIVELERYNKYGTIYGHFEGSKPLLSVGDPTLIRNILVKDFQAFSWRREFASGNEIMDKVITVLQGEDWKRVRTIITPTFTTGKIKKMLDIFKDCCKTLIQNFRKSAQKGNPVEVKRIYGTFAMDVIASACFSTKIDSHNDPNNEFVQAAHEVFNTFQSWRIFLYVLFPEIQKFFKLHVFPPKPLEFFTNVTFQIIEERKKSGQTRNDFLQLLLDTAKETHDENQLEMEKESDDITANYGKDNSELFKNTYSKKTLSLTELVAQCITFFLGGSDTTASTLSFATYVLALNEDVQEKLIEEVDEALEANNGELTYEAIQSMKYLDNVIAETMRMYPPFIRLERSATEDYKLGDTGLTIPKGTIVTIPVYAMHRDPKFYPEPEKFDPDRFTPEERAKRDQYAYLPFGAGPRNCVGMRFALMEAKVCLAHVVSNFRIKRCAETKVPLECALGAGFLLPKEVMVKLDIRSGNTKPR